MIGNSYLRALFQYPDEDTAINQLLELLKTEDPGLLASLHESEEVDNFTTQELEFLTKAGALIDHFLQLSGLEVPQWIRDKRLSFERPYYYPTRLSDFEKFRLQYTNPAPFKARNVYFDLDGIERV